MSRRNIIRNRAIRKNRKTTKGKIRKIRSRKIRKTIKRKMGKIRRSRTRTSEEDRTKR
jgi:hypothetical protein